MMLKGSGRAAACSAAATTIVSALSLESRTSEHPIFAVVEGAADRSPAALSSPTNLWHSDARFPAPPRRVPKAPPRLPRLRLRPAVYGRPPGFVGPSRVCDWGDGQGQTRPASSSVERSLRSCGLPRKRRLLTAGKGLVRRCSIELRITSTNGVTPSAGR